MRSINHAGNKDLQILLAWQAYLFNERHSGLKEDPDVFAGLYEVCRKYGNRFCTRFTPDGAEFTAMAEGADGEFFTADTRGRVMSWKGDQPARGFTLLWSGNKKISSMAVSPDVSWLACGTESSEIVMIPIDEDSIGYLLNDTTGKITSVVFTDRDHLYASTAGGSVNEWDLKKRTAIPVFSDASGIAALEFSAGNSTLAALTLDGRVLLRQTEAGGSNSVLNSGNKVLTSHRFIPGGESLATGDSNGIIDIWNTSTGKAQGSAEGHDAPVISIAFDPTDSQMLTADDSGEIRLWSMANLAQPPVVFTDGGKDVLTLVFSDGGDAFLSASGSDVVRRPAHIRCMTDGLCDKVTRNLTEQEWTAYIGQDIEYEPTCPNREYRIRVREIRGAR
jgi:WD40 repeat protein